MSSTTRTLSRWSVIVFAAGSLAGCAVLTVGGAVVGAAISVTGAVVSTGVELTGKAIGAGIDALSDDEGDDSGIVIKYTERPASGAVPPVASSPPPPAPVPAPAEPGRPSPLR